MKRLVSAVISAQWGSLPIERGLDVAYRSVFKSSTDSVATRASIETKTRSLTLPFRSAEAFVIEDTKDPNETRDVLTEFVNVAAPLRSG